MKYFIRNIRIGIKNLIRWFPVIWNDRQWDSYYFFKIIRRKLEIMEPFYRYDAMVLRREKEADRMKVCIMLLDRIIKDNYHEMAYKKFDKKWGESEMLFNEDGSLNIAYENVKTEEDEKNKNKDIKESHNKEEFLINQDIEYLFKILNKRIRFWWD